ncbi:TrbI/VirB10 family protein [Trinickia mobilis]|uniref:TrbI/VirB10 family protein n=1 Tax=Trinickia mobilis TaxID=2816356 RepID=UPI001F5C6EDF|nr:TrbI/VirB10 family protein [Trinickia mobilis]
MLAIGTVGGLVMLVVVAVFSLPDPEVAAKEAQAKALEKKAKQDEKASDDGTRASTPKSVADAANGVAQPTPVSAPAAADAAGSATGSGAPASAPSGAGTSTASGGRVDPLAPPGGGQAGGPGGTRVPGINNGQGQPAQLTALQQDDMQQELTRRQLLRSAAESKLSDSTSTQGSPNAAAAAPALPSLGGLSSQANPLGGAGMGAQASAADDPNKQIHKEAFLNAAATAVPSTYLSTSLQPPRSPYQIDLGWEIHAMMDSKLNSDLPGTLRAHVSENVMDSATGRYVLIPGGSRLIGHYDSQVAFGQSRVLVVWDTIKFPDSSELQIQGMPGTDQQGAAGLTGDIDNHLWPMLKAAVFMSVITAGAQLSQPQSSNASGTYSAPTVSQQLTAQLGQQLGQTTGQMISRYLNVQPTITTLHGTRFSILVKQNIAFDHPWSWQ